MLLEVAENLTNDNTTGKELKEQIEKAQALSKVSEQVVNLQTVAVKELDTKVKAMKMAASIGVYYKPDGLNVTPIKQVNTPKKKSIPDKGITPEGLPYEL